MREDLIKNIKQKNKIAAWNLFSSRFLHFALSVIVLIACDQRKSLVDQELYTGPLASLDSMDTYISDSANRVMHLKAPKQNDYENKDKEWPEGFLMESFNSRGVISTIIKANHVTYSKENDLYHATGNVIVRNIADGDELTTEELFWNATKEKIYTEKFVTINTDGEIHTGEGLDSNQDFTEYRILKPNGTFTLEDDPKKPSQKAIPLDN